MDMPNLKSSERSFLHIWRPKSSVNKSFGHISLELNNGYISFWPENGTTKRCHIENDSCPAACYKYKTVEEEIEEHGHPDTLSVYKLDTQSIQLWWEQFLLDKPKYNVRYQNCATVVHEALCVGSSWFKENTKDCSGIKTPERVFDYVREGYNEKDKNTRFGCGSTCKHCLSLKPYRFLGLFPFFFYKFCLGPLKLWQYVKHLVGLFKPEQADQEQEDTEETSFNVMIRPEENSYSESGKAICQPEGVENINLCIPIPSMYDNDENVRHRQVDNR